MPSGRFQLIYALCHCTCTARFSSLPSFPLFASRIRELGSALSTRMVYVQNLGILQIQDSVQVRSEKKQQQLDSFAIRSQNLQSIRQTQDRYPGGRLLSLLVLMFEAHLLPPLGNGQLQQFVIKMSDCLWIAPVTNKGLHNLALTGFLHALKLVMLDYIFVAGSHRCSCRCRLYRYAIEVMLKDHITGFRLIRIDLVKSKCCVINIGCLICGLF